TPGPFAASFYFPFPTLSPLRSLLIPHITISTSRVVLRRANVTGISRRCIRGIEVAWNGPIHGRAGVADDDWSGLFVFDQPARDQAENGGLGTGIADRFRVSGVLLDARPDAILARGQWREQAARVRVCGIGICVWR